MLNAENSATGILQNGDAKSLDCTKPNTNPKTNYNPNPKLTLILIPHHQPQNTVTDFPHSAFTTAQMC